MSTNVVITGAGRDRVGIVADLSEALYESGCNLLDSSMTLLRNEFAVIMMAQIPDGQSPEDLRAKLSSLEHKLGLHLILRELSDDEIKEPGSSGVPYIVSVYAADKPGIVAGVTRALSDLGANLTDVETKRTSSGNSLFLMILEIELSPEISESQLRDTLKRVSNELAVDISMEALEVVEL
ncbi:MAG: ACT domain-containing protein [Cyanobacteria bacterium]|nr:ACT domain-containing protein [Cyanobacteriota bacterium]